MNPTTGGQLCARARFWASLRVDDELSELEGALLDAHLARCADCREFEAAATGSATLLRGAPLEAVPQVVLPSDGSRRGGALLGTLAAAALVGAAVVAGLVQAGSTGGTSPTAVRSVSVVASVETPDQLRRLRRTSLLNERPLPRNISAEPI